MKPHELACSYYLEQRGYSGIRPFRTAQLADRSWLMWVELPEGELLLQLSWDWRSEEWDVFTVYFEVD